MHKGVPLWNAMHNTQHSNRLSMTNQYLYRQLKTVIELFELNLNFLEPFERSWVQHVVDESLKVIADANTVSSTGSQKLYDRTQSQSSEPTSITPPVARNDDIDILFTSAKKLDSVHSLLSCSYDRWLWLRYSRAEFGGLHIRIDHHEDLLQQQEQQLKLKSSASLPLSEHGVTVPQIASEINASQQTMITNMRQQESQGVVYDETIEKWRKVAEVVPENTNTSLHVSSSKSQGHYDVFVPKVRGKNCSCTVDSQGSTAMTGRLSQSILQDGSRGTDTVSSHSSPSFSHSRRKATRTMSCENHSKPHSDLSRGFDAHQAVQRMLSPTLHNSYDKEPVIATAEIPVTSQTNPPRPNVITYLPYHVRPGSSSASQPSSQVSQKTLVPNEPWASLTPGNIAGGSRVSAEDYSLPISQQPDTSAASHTYRSRGRKWLEQQAKTFG